MTIEVVLPGALTTVQDWPGRVGLWELGVPPSGPMDPRSFRIANLLAGNPEGAAALEVTLAGPTLRFEQATTVAVCGAPVDVTLDGRSAETWAPIDVPAGGVLAVGAITGPGMRCTVAVRGGIAADATLGSVASFVAAGLGPPPLAKDARLAVGAVGPAGPPRPTDVTRSAPPQAGRLARLGRALAPVLADRTGLRVVPGPHGAPDFLTEAGLRSLFGEPWTVHHQSDRTGVRLTGPAPEFARGDGGAAGLHPSNVLDSAYGVGTIMLSGDVAVVVGVDGPSLGGFAAIGQVIAADRWKLGQLRAADRVLLQPVTAEGAVAAWAEAEAETASLRAPGERPVPSTFSLAQALAASQPMAWRRAPVPRAVLDWPGDGAHGPITYRQAGEGALLVEFGEPEVDLRSRVRVHTLQQLLRAEPAPAWSDLTPGVRSLHIQFDPARISTARLIDLITTLESGSPAPEAVTIAARTVHMPLAWRHSQAMLAMERYASVSPNAPWLPDNIEFIRRINGLADEAAVRRIVADARYLVLGLGDVYMGAPVAVPVDPRHRLVTTKYTPARTWTPANAVGIGGAFLCVYGIEGPGGYQLVGRTVPIWYPSDPRPCLLHHFDQLRFELLGEPELEELRAEAVHGSWRPRTEPLAFSLDRHAEFVARHGPEIDVFTAGRERAFARERAAWRAAA